ncbi:hypothetical protein C2G38_2247358 [Gigaspora rosea]|uniref:BZIP domain-containing protein n=1 Tax=Gigaspora rosea TaxID=44941 RepID=A0A397V2Q9_9GLOM|nr:hypothetical protein C2G38_2247358 [Gigaspora rosea]
MDFFNFFCLTIFLFICYLIIDLSQIEDKFILVINYDDEGSVKATNYNSVKEATADTVKEKDMKKENHEIERIRKESLLLKKKNKLLKQENDRLRQMNKRVMNNCLLLKQENDRVRKESFLLRLNNKRVREECSLLKQENDYLHLKKENDQNFTNSEYFVQYYNDDYFQNLTLQLTEEIRRLTAKIEKKDTKLRALTKYLIICFNFIGFNVEKATLLAIFRNEELDHVVTKIDAAPLHGPISIAQTD